MTKSHEAWFYHVDQDLLTARALLREEIFPNACFHAQQAVEKAMKGLLIAQGRPCPKTHDLVHLNDLLGSPEWMETRIDQLNLFNQLYIPIRYPDAVVGTLPDRLPGQRDAENFLQWAEEICQLIRGKI